MPEKKNLLKKQLHKDSVVNQVVKQITDSIIAGDLKPGDKLPTEPEPVSYTHLTLPTIA